MKEILVSENSAGKRFDSFLDAYFKDASRGFIYKMLRKKNITLNGKKADGTEKLKNGDVIKVFFSDETFDKMRGESENRDSYKGAFEKLGPMEIIYEDEDILLINKPAGLLSQKAEKTDVSLNEWLIDYLVKEGKITEESLSTYRPSICNRLDRNTSGLVICARSLAGARMMNLLIKERKVDKYYRTVVSGNLHKDALKPTASGNLYKEALKSSGPGDSDKIIIRGYLIKDERKNKVVILDKAPDEANIIYKGAGASYIETEYQVLKYIPESDVSLLEVKLITGKTHQIRAHLSSIGHPVLGDVKYGGRKIDIGNQDSAATSSYQLLHSYRLVFPKIEDERFAYLSGREFIAPLPDIFKSFV